MLSRRISFKFGILSAGALLAIAACTANGATSVDPEAQKYAAAAAVGNMFEVQSSELAISNAQSQDVKNFARMMIADHLRSTESLKEAVARIDDGISLPTGLDPSHEALLDRLKISHGANFDELYSAIQVDAYKDAYKLHHNYSQAGEVPALKAIAVSALPMIERHLMDVQRLPGK